MFYVQKEGEKDPYAFVFKKFCKVSAFSLLIVATQLSLHIEESSCWKEQGGLETNTATLILAQAASFGWRSINV